MKKVEEVQRSHFSSESCLPLDYILQIPGKTHKVTLILYVPALPEWLKGQLFPQITVTSLTN